MCSHYRSRCKGLCQNKKQEFDQYTKGGHFCAAHMTLNGVFHESIGSCGKDVCLSIWWPWIWILYCIQKIINLHFGLLRLPGSSTKHIQIKQTMIYTWLIPCFSYGSRLTYRFILALKNRYRWSKGNYIWVFFKPIEDWRVPCKSKIEIPRDVRNSRSENMTSSGENGFNKNKCKSQIGQDRVSGGVSVFCWLAASVSMFYGKLPKFGNKVKSVIRSSSVISSQIGVMSDQLRVSMYMAMSQNVM